MAQDNTVFKRPIETKSVNVNTWDIGRDIVSVPEVKVGGEKVKLNLSMIEETSENTLNG